MMNGILVCLSIDISVHIESKKKKKVKLLNVISDSLIFCVYFTDQVETYIFFSK